MKVKVHLLNQDVERDIRSAALNTVNKPYTKGNFDRDKIMEYMISEHSPIRRMHLEIHLQEIDQFTSVHFRTHGTFQEHFVSTSRPDRAGKMRKLEDTKSHVIDTNPKALIDMMRERLCIRDVAPDTFAWASAIKHAVMDYDDQWVRVLGYCLVPKCVYRCGCPNFGTACGLYSQADAVAPSIDDRYYRYNKWGGFL